LETYARSFAYFQLGQAGITGCTFTSEGELKQGKSLEGQENIPPE